MQDTLTELRELNTKRHPYFGMGEIKEVSIEFKTLELLGETGEVANVVKKILRGDEYVLDKKEQITPIQLLVRELADVIICVDLLAAKYDIDLVDAVKKKFDKTSDDRGYPVRFRNDYMPF